MFDSVKFIAYMDAFRAATDHTGTCEACQSGLPCEAGDPLHADFTARHTDWQNRHHATTTEGTTTMTANETTETVRHTADIICIREGLIRSVLLIERGKAPHKGQDALPGGHVNAGESPLDAAVRELREETGVRVPASWLREVGVYDAPGRDPRGNYSSTAYVVTVASDTVAVAADDAKRARWIPVEELQGDLSDLAFDHGVILADALRLTGDRRA